MVGRRDVVSAASVFDPSGGELAAPPPGRSHRVFAGGETGPSRPPRSPAPAIRVRGTSAARREGQAPWTKAAGGDGLALATPDKILRWYREQVAAKYDGSRARSRSGRPPSQPDKIAELLTMARQNPSWSYIRLRGALANVGLDFFNVEVLTAGGLVRYLVLFVHLMLEVSANANATEL